VLLDDLFLSDITLSTEWHSKLVPIKRIIRIESIAEQLITSSSIQTFAQFEKCFQSALEDYKVSGYSDLYYTLTVYQRRTTMQWHLNR
jgi:hypothetical protein